MLTESCMEVCNSAIHKWFYEYHWSLVIICMVYNVLFHVGLATTSHGVLE